MRIRLENLQKVFGDQTVLKGVDFDDEVTTMALIGPSGGGKSTLLRIVGGLENPTSGEVWVEGRRVDYKAHSLPEYRASLGFVFQHSGLFDHLTALENIALPLRVVHEVDAETARERATTLLRQFGLEGEANKHPAQLSGGERQRVAIARAIAPKPRLLLLDEPTSALDPEYTAEVLNVINQLREEGARFLIVTHEMGFAREVGSRVLFMDAGRIAEQGSPEDIFSHPQSARLQDFLRKVL
mgnify:CR=1 FL=1